MKTPEVPEPTGADPAPVAVPEPEEQSPPENTPGDASPPENTTGDEKTTSSGRLAPEVIQKRVRANFGSMRTCYENGLRSDPKLKGRVVVRFVIGTDGSVTSVTSSGDIPDEAVKSCVAEAVRKITFPTPEGGTVTVSYPFVFTPDAK